MQEILANPIFETKIHSAVFLRQDIIVKSDSIGIDSSIANAIKFLFGKDAYLEESIIEGQNCIVIKNADFILSGARTINADWSCKEIK